MSPKLLELIQDYGDARSWHESAGGNYTRKGTRQNKRYLVMAAEKFTRAATALEVAVDELERRAGESGQ